MQDEKTEAATTPEPNTYRVAVIVHCPGCGAVTVVPSPQVVLAGLQAQPLDFKCEKCGHAEQLIAGHEPMLKAAPARDIRPANMGEVLALNRDPNRHARRAAAAGAPVILGPGGRPV